MNQISTMIAGAACAITLTGAAVLAVPTSSAAPDVLAAPARCTNADLVASFAVTGGAAGSLYGRMRLTNVSDRACVTGGFGGISYVGDGDGTQIGRSAVRERAAQARSYVVRPGQRLVSTVQLSNAQNYPASTCRRARVDGFRVYVPNATRSQFVRFRTLGCRNHAVHLLHQRPYYRP